jgi:uncharacterized protein
MLKHTFCHMPGISLGRERGLWDAGARTWDQLDTPGAAEGIARVSRRVKPHLEESRARLGRGDARYFSDLLPAHERWRLFRDFRPAVVYLDIETTGLCAGEGAITTIALYDGKAIRHYVKGENLRDFGGDVRGYGLVVTYNGACFDLPFIERALGVTISAPHIDLRYLLARLGYRGGLKGCERQLGISRGGLEGVDGYTAVLLWHEYARRDDRKALETLLAYNIEDAVNLERLMVAAYNMKLRETPFHEDCLPDPEPPPVPFKADRGTLRRLAQTH